MNHSRLSNFYISLLKGEPLFQKISEIEKDDVIIWHISDLHFGNSLSGSGCLDFVFIQNVLASIFKKLPFLKRNIYRKYGILNPGNSEEILKKFKQVVSNREKNKNDVFLITGDLTKKGSGKEVDRYIKFKDFLKDYSDNVLEVPGNHDYWSGKNFIFTAVRSLMTQLIPFKGKIKIVKKFPFKNSIDNFIKRNVLVEFKNKPFTYKEIVIKEMKVLIVLVDSNYRDRDVVAQGIFPIENFEVELKDVLSKAYGLKILGIHHHLIDYLHSQEGNWKYFRHEFTTRVDNSLNAYKLLEKLSFNFVMHGHKHMQDTRIFTGHKNYGLFLAAPAAFLDSEEVGDEKIGFNIICFDKHYHFVIRIEYRDEDYRCVHIEKFRRV